VSWGWGGLYSPQQLTTGVPMNQTHYLAKDKHDGYWEVLTHAKFQEAKEEFHKPIEIASLPAQVAALYYIARHMNLGDRAERFWKFNAADKVESGGRIAYALILMEME